MIKNPYKDLTQDQFWECECTKDFIKPKSITFCPSCNFHQEDSPDSHQSEVEQHYKLEYTKIC